MSRHVLLAVVFLLLAVALALAGGWHVPRDERVVSANGRYYVVLRRTEDWEGEFVVAERKAGSPAVKAVVSRTFDDERPDPEVRVREGDVVHSEGTLDEFPDVLLVSSKGLGFAALGDWDDIAECWVAIFSLKGELLHSLKVEPPPADGLAGRILGAALWRGAWMDDETGEVLLLANTGHLRAVSFATGAVRLGNAADAARGLDSPDPVTRSLALEFLAWRRLRAHAKCYAELYESKTEPTAVRLRAAVALGALGDRRGLGLVLEAAHPDSEGFDWRDEVYALGQVPALVRREDTPDALEKVFLDRDLPDWEGESSVPVLAAHLTDYGSLKAAERLAMIGSPRALPALLGVLDSEDEKVASAAVRAVIVLGSLDVADLLAEILLEGTACDDLLVEYFAGVRHRDASPALAAALKRGTADPGAIHRALLFQKER